MSDRPDHTGNVYIANATITVEGTVSISGNVSVQQVGDWYVNAIQSGNWNVGQVGTWNVNAIQSGAWTVSISGTVNITGNVNITNSSITVEPKAGATFNISGNVNITGGTITVDTVGSITSGNVTVNGNVNVATQGGQNIIIDKLTQSAYQPETRILNLYVNTPPDSYVYINAPRGIIFARGCRGLIYSLAVWLKNTSGSDQTTTVSLKPYPNGPTIVSANYTVPNNTNGWFYIINADYQPIKSLMWMYDQLCVEFSTNANIYIGVDNDLPSYTDYVIYSGAVYSTRKFMASAQIGGLTVGDLPVSGTVNTIQIPNTSLGSGTASYFVSAGSEMSFVTITGGGTLIYLLMWLGHSSMSYRIYVDGTLLPEYAPGSNSPDDLHIGFTASTPGIQLIRYTAGAGDNNIAITLPIQFMRSLEIRIYNPQSTSYAAAVQVWCNMIK